MARARNIKPGFFKNEELGAIPMGARLLFVGMWTLADREGRLEDRPARIAAEVFPYDREICVSTVSNWIDALAGFVTRYTVNGGKYIAINNFAKHQTPHVKEQASTIPAPDLHQTCTVQAPDMPLPTQLLAPPDSLNPSSLNPDSLNPEKTILPGADAPADRLAEMGWVGVSKTPEDVCAAIAALRCDEFPESRALNSPFMIVCRLTWFDDFWAFYWRKDDKRKARIKYFEKVTSAKLQEEVENAVIAQAPEMMAREKQHRKLAATWLHGECWTNEPTFLDGGE